MNDSMLDSDLRDFGTEGQSMSRFDFMEQFPEESEVEFDGRPGVVKQYNRDYVIIDFNEPDEYFMSDPDLIEEVELDLLIESMFPAEEY